MVNLKLNRKTLQGQVNQHNEFIGKYQLNKEEMHYLTKGNMEDLRFYTIMERMLVVQNDCKSLITSGEHEQTGYNHYFLF